MKKSTWLALGMVSAAAGYALFKNRQAHVAEQYKWIRSQYLELSVLGCPVCHFELTCLTQSNGQILWCEVCQKEYPVVGGIPHFFRPGELSGWNKTFAFAYDWFSWGYRLFSAAAFALIGMSEEEGRREILDHLNPGGGRVLEVSIGPGVNLPYLVRRSDVGDIYGMDISQGQLNRCRAYIAHHDWNIHLQLGNAEQLPYQDNSFSGVFHIGGINFFNDKQKAIQEMIRVAKPGTRVLICDENERGAKAYERLLPGFKHMAGDYRQTIAAPVDLIPAEMLDISVFDVWKGWFYCISFTKP